MDEVYRDINQIAGYPLTILIILREEGVATRNRIKMITDLSLPTLRKHLSKLEVLGYVERVDDPGKHNPEYSLSPEAALLGFMNTESEKIFSFSHSSSIKDIKLTSNLSNNTTIDQSEKIFPICEEVEIFLEEKDVWKRIKWN